MSTATVTVKVALDDESKALLKATTAALKGVKVGGKKPAEDDDAGDDAGDGDGDDTDFDTEADGDGDDDAGDGDGDGDDAGPTLDDVGEAMKAYATAKGPGGAGSKALAMKLLKAKGGVDKLSSLKPAKFDAVIKGCKAATVALKKKK